MLVTNLSKLRHAKVQLVTNIARQRKANRSKAGILVSLLFYTTRGECCCILKQHLLEACTALPWLTYVVA